MKTIDIMSQGDTGKYQLIIDREDFDPRLDEFKVRLSWGFYDEHVDIRKDEMFHDEEWNVFFMFDSTKMHGMITAECEYLVPDSDVAFPQEGDAREEEWYRVNVDRQLLCLVTTSATACTQKCANKCNEHLVHYKRTLRSDANSLYAIVRAQPVIVTDSDGELVRIRKHVLD